MAEYFTVRLNRIWVEHNREIGKAEAKIMSFVTSGDVPLPTLDGLLQTNDQQEKKNIIVAATRGVLSSRRLVQIDNVKDKNYITFGHSGISIYTTSKIPLDFNMSVIVLENDEDVRALGAAIDSIVTTPEFGSFMDNLLIALGASVTPALTATVEISKYLAQIVANLMKGNKDDQIGVYLTSLNRFEHYKHGEYKVNDSPGVVGNITVDFTVFGTTY